jgi:hypothetical protein
LTENLRQKRVAICNEILPILKAQDKNFHDLVTGDESWFMQQYEYEMQ